MITKEQAISLRHGDYMHHVSATNADGTPQRFRVTGKVKTWKTRQAEFRIPVKRGMYETGYIDDSNVDEFNLGDGS